MINKKLHKSAFSSGKETSLKRLFSKKNNYIFFNPLNNVPNYLIDLYQNNNFKLDPDFDFIMIKNESYFVEDSTAGDMLDFVSDLFGNLKAFYNNKLVKNANNSNQAAGIDFRNMEPNSVNFSTDYRNSLQKTIKNFLNNYCKNYEVQKRIVDFPSFLNEFYSFCSILGNKLVITKQAFINQSNYSHKSCGLTFQFNLKDSNSDLEKFNKYLGEENTEYMAFVSFASRYGFYPNYRLPNQFICNLNDYKVLQAANKRIVEKKYIQRTGKQPTKDRLEQELKKDINTKISYRMLLDNYFVKAYETDFDDFVAILGYAYNQFVSFFPTAVSFEVNNPEFLTVTKNNRTQITINNINSPDQIKAFYRIYFLIRLLETDGFSFAGDISKISKTIGDLSETLDSPGMLRYINEQTKRLTINRVAY